MSESVGILTRRVMRPTWFRVRWTQIDYACREDSGSLKPVPLGTTRKRLYCGQCQAERCLFASNEYEDLAPVKSKDGRTSKPAQQRALGLNTKGQPLQENCYNCVFLRVKLAGYVCWWEPEAKPVRMYTIRTRKVEQTGCNRFEMRLVMEIPQLEIS